MHDIWNPWHGCRRISEGCANCYMFHLDSLRDRDGGLIYRTDSFRYPLQKDRAGHYRIRSGEMIRVCMTSDFFLEEADAWRPEAWSMMHERSDVIFYILTKRADRIRECLPPDWGEGWENIFLNVTAENQRRADERIPVLLSIPARHRGVMAAPLIGSIDMSRYLSTGMIDQVIAGGENYGGARPCCYEWAERLFLDCRAADVRFAFIETGNVYCRNGRRYRFRSKEEQSRTAYRTGLYNPGRKIIFRLEPQQGDLFGMDAYVPSFRSPRCRECGMRVICNGCSECGRCAIP